MTLTAFNNTQKLAQPLLKNAKPLSKVALASTILVCITACNPAPVNVHKATKIEPQNAASSTAKNNTVQPSEVAHKAVVYQVFTRLYGNTNTTNQPWGTINQNGVGKFSDFTSAALNDIKSLGVTHVWYTGVPHHAVINDYSAIGISDDDPDVVKGRAGSPYAVKDYYNVNPDLADNPANRLAEFEALIARTHQHDMKVIIDIVPNHVARNYQSISNPVGVNDFGSSDNTQVEYAKHNNFYYIQGQDFTVPAHDNGYLPLGGEAHPFADGQFSESPAKWTGNGSRLARPKANDWYETVKINYGVKPDGSYDFPRLPQDYANKSSLEHYQFWQTQAADSIPDSWIKFKQITQFWLAKGVDGFRYDMAEMVPVEFWSYLNSHIKHTNPQAFLLAEVYNPALYRDYIHRGKMDYLYDKVDLYDTLKDIIHGKKSTAEIVKVQDKVLDIEAHMLHFLENHDEQRIASPDFAGDPLKALPAMVVSTTLSRSPTLLYFGQDVGEAGAENAGFGQATRTSIFDYIGVPAHQRWMNNGKFDGGQSTTDERELRHYYQTLLNLSHSAPALKGEYLELDTLQRSANVTGYDDTVFAFARIAKNQQLIVVSNFDAKASKILNLVIPHQLVTQWNTNQTESISLTNLLAADSPALTLTTDLKAVDSTGSISLKLAPLESVILTLPSTQGM